MPRPQRLESFPEVYWLILKKVKEEGRYLAKFPSKKLCERAKNKFGALFSTIRAKGDEAQKALAAGITMRVFDSDVEGWRIELVKEEEDGLLALLGSGLLEKAEPPQDDAEAMLMEHLDELGSKLGS